MDVLGLPASAQAHGLTTYDAAYLELAMWPDLPLATAESDAQSGHRSGGLQRHLSAETVARFDCRIPQPDRPDHQNRARSRSSARCRSSCSIFRRTRSRVTDMARAATAPAAASARAIDRKSTRLNSV